MKLYATTTSERATKGQGGNITVETMYQFREKSGYNAKIARTGIYMDQEKRPIVYLEIGHDVEGVFHATEKVEFTRHDGVSFVWTKT